MRISRHFLVNNEIQVWWADLDNPCRSHSELKELLSPDELERALRFKFPIDQQHFIAARGQLRVLLASYLSIEPAMVKFTYNTQGKPQLAGDSQPIEFNLAHSEGRALYAFALDVAVGIDLESQERDLEAEALAERFLSSAEYESLMALPIALRREAFLRAWTRKEAVIKALGLGLSFPLEEFTITLGPDEPARLVSIKDDDAQAWSLISLEPAPGWLAALAFRARDCSIKIMSLLHSLC